MNFLYAISGWQWALAGAVPLGIFALYFLKLKRKPLQVPSTFLWRKSIEDLHVNSLWQKLRQSILLLLQLLVAAAVILALLRPTLDSTDQGDHIILLIDNSASMSASDVSPSRLDAAKAKAIEIVNQMEQGDAAMVIAFNESARVASSYTKNVAVLKQAIADIEQTSLQTDINEAITIASGLANPQRAGEEDAEAVPATVYLLSDGNFANAADLSLGNLSMEFLAIGKSSNNVGIVALAARPSDLQPDRLDVFARVRNFSTEAIQTTAELKAEGQVVDIQQTQIEAGAEQPMVFRLQSTDSVALSLELDIKDDFPLDNQAWAVVNPPRLARVLVVGDPNPILKASLETEQLAGFTRIDYQPPTFIETTDFASLQAPVLKDDSGTAIDAGGSYDLVIFDRTAPPTMPECNTLFLGTTPSYLSAVPRQAVDGPVILNWSTSHPLLRFLQLDDVNIAAAFTMELPRGADKLIESDQGTLFFSVPRGVFSDLVLTFPLVDSAGAWQTDWPLKPSFPLFVMNAVRTLGGTEADRRQSVQSGEPVSLRAEGSAETATVKSPNGAEGKLKRTARGYFEFLNTDQLGIYESESGDNKRRFAVNLFSDRESEIKPASDIQIGAVQAKDKSSEFSARRELWKYLACLAFVLLLLEWYIYNRRVYL